MSITKQDVRDAVHIYHWLKDRCENLIVDNWLRSRATVHSVHIYKNDNDIEMLNICFDYYCCGETDFDEDDVPMNWLFLSDNELEEARSKEHDRRKQIEEEAERQRELNEAEEKERKERGQYERLKAKYEN